MPVGTLTSTKQPKSKNESEGRFLTPARRAAIKKHSVKNGRKFFRFSWKTSGQLTGLIQRIANNIAGFGRNNEPPSQ